MDTPILFGEWLKQRRKALDLTRDELATRAGCSVFALRKIESGERRPSKQLAGLLAAALEISEDEQLTFIRVARGDINLERLPSSKSSKPPVSVPDYLGQYQALESGTLEADAPIMLSTELEPASRHLPVPPTPLLGRDSELAALERLFKGSQCRLLTLTGMGGIGKTRLAIEFAARQRNAFPGGVHFVPLASINFAESIVPAIAETLEYSFSGPTDLKEQLIQYMSSTMKQSALLVLDNLEHLITQSIEAVELVSELFQRILHLKILVTSRERLNLQGEWMYELHGLPVPPVELVDKLDEYSAATLFIQRARHIKTNFELGESEKNELVQICRLVEGIPLAIELAAAWVGMFTCGEIAREIESNIDFLSTSMRDMPERHRSLRATFDHSWKLLSDQERDVLSCLSVFRGGFDRNAAEEVAGATLSLLASLVSKSLVMRTERGRYDLHEVIRQYAWSHHQKHPYRSGTHERHFNYFFAFVEERQNKLKSAAQQETMRELTAEIDNIRAAWTWAVERKKYSPLTRAVRGLGWYFEIAGLYNEGIETFEPLRRGLETKINDTKQVRLLGMILLQQALLHFRKGEFEHAQSYYSESVAHLRKIGDKSLLADSLIFLGTILHLNGEYQQAESLLQEGLGYARSVHDRWFEAFGEYNLGYIAGIKGCYAEGYEQQLKALNVWRSIGDPQSISLGLNFMIPNLTKLGKFKEAKAFMRESIALCEQSKNRWGLGTAYRNMGLATMGTGQYAEAKTFFQKGLEIFREYFVGWDIAITLTYLGDAERLNGDLGSAAETYRDAVKLSLEANALPILLAGLAGVADIQAQTGNFKFALELAYIIKNHASATEGIKERMERSGLEWESKAGKSQVKAARAITKDNTVESMVQKILDTYIEPHI